MPGILIVDANIMQRLSPGVFELYKIFHVHSRIIFIRIRTEINIPKIKSIERIDYSNE
jgi:hypothetical protein